MSGEAIAILGLAICAGLCGVGSAIGLYKTGSAAAGVLAEDAKKFSKVMILVLLPATQGIYGFVMALVGQGRGECGHERRKRLADIRVRHAFGDHGPRFRDLSGQSGDQLYLCGGEGRKTVG